MWGVKNKNVNDTSRKSTESSIDTGVSWGN